MSLYRRVLILGGARSGKSRTALQLAEQASAKRIYVATAQAFDDEMRERIALHRQRCGRDFRPYSVAAERYKPHEENNCIRECAV